MAMGNTVIVVPPERFPLCATDFYQVLETSDVPPGVLNIVTGARNSLATILAEHDDVDAVWYFGDKDGARQVEFASAGNMKRTWVHAETQLDWIGIGSHAEEFLRECTQVKNIWAPYGA
jgi:aldehyde dehydrogenase (NAD+)